MGCAFDYPKMIGALIAAEPIRFHEFLSHNPTIRVRGRPGGLYLPKL
jgi:hypothetical protein